MWACNDMFVELLVVGCPPNPDTDPDDVGDVAAALAESANEFARNRNITTGMHGSRDLVVRDGEPSGAAP